MLFQNYVNIATNLHYTPANYHEAMASPNTKEWREATNEEINNL